jgi:ketosteroid isomerase-like protein
MSNAERLMAILTPAFGEGELDVSAGFLERLGEQLAPISAEEITGSMTGDSAFTTEFQGRDGLLETWADWLDTFARVRLEIETVEEVGGNVVTFVNQIGTTRHGVELAQPSAAVWKFRDGKLVRVEFHLDREKARKSASKPA